MALAEENDVVSKEGAKNGEWVKISMTKNRIMGVDQFIEDPSSLGLKDLVFVKSLADDTKVTIPGVERPWFSKAKSFIQPNHDTDRILLSESQRNITDYLVAVIDSLATDYDSTDEASVCCIHLPLLKKLHGAEPIFGPKTMKLILRSKSTFKAEALKDVTINEPSSAPAKGNKNSSASKVHSAHVGHNKIISLERKINLRNPQHAFRKCKACGSPNHTTTDHYDIDIELFKRGEALQAKKVYFLKNKSQAPEPIMSFIKRVENQNDIKVKQLRTDNATEFKNSILVNFYDEKGISQNFSSPYTPEQNGVAERKNKTLIEAARTMLSGSVFSKQY
nr:retrovirus-related Pol polyprotein from transposon TNT 1-94 [Tanacetum cinerariifolium]